MKILKLELKSYKRLMLNNISRFVITPKDRVQIIIGTNGSGKSSVLRELSPLPAAHTDYFLGGSKTIVLSHQGTEYTLISDFTKGQRHSFLKDNSEELNTGGTLTIQKELVKRIFNYDQSIHDLYLGHTTFTQMSVQQRREFLTDLSGGDLDYALNIFKLLKTAHRDTQGVIKHLASRLVTISAKKLQERDIAEIQSFVKLLQDELTLLMSNSLSVETSFYKDWEAVLESTNVWKRLSRQILDTKPFYYNNHPISYAELPALIADTKDKLSVEKAQIEWLSNEVHSVKELLKSLNNIHATTLDGLNVYHRDLIAKKTELYKRIRQFQTIPNAWMAIEANKTVSEHIETYIGNIANNSDGWYSLQRMNENKQIVDRLNEKYAVYKKEQQRILNHIEHCKQTDPIKCTNCGYKWIPGFEAQQVVQITADLEKITQAMDSLEKERNEAIDVVTRITEYQNSLKNFKAFMDQFPVLKPFMDKTIEEKLLISSPSRVLALFTQWVEESEIHADIEKCDRELNESKDAMSYVLQHEDEGGSVYLMNGKLEDLENALEIRIQNKERLTKQLEIFKQAEIAANKLANLYWEWERANEAMAVDFNNYAMSYKDHLIKKVITEHQSDLALNNSILIDALLADKETESLIASLANENESNKAFKILMDILSPVDGLIADQLKGFLEQFVNQMNRIINQIWTYPLQIKPCGFESGELDYKFPMLVGTDTTPVADSALGSGAQKDIINFAFKLAVIVFKNMQDYPLYLDELAPTLDEKHRINITRFVHDYTDAHYCNQLFMISHYQPSYGTFNNADVCIMDTTNMLNIPTIYNRHVIMES